jgi:hypothetical protein
MTIIDSHQNLIKDHFVNGEFEHSQMISTPIGDQNASKLFSTHFHSDQERPPSLCRNLKQFPGGLPTKCQLGFKIKNWKNPFPIYSDLKAVTIYFVQKTFRKNQMLTSQRLNFTRVRPWGGGEICPPRSELGPGGELFPLGLGEHTLLFRRMEGPTEDLQP